MFALSPRTMAKIRRPTSTPAVDVNAPRQLRSSQLTSTMAQPSVRAQVSKGNSKPSSRKGIPGHEKEGDPLPVNGVSNRKAKDFPRQPPAPASPGVEEVSNISDTLDGVHALGEDEGATQGLSTKDAAINAVLDSEGDAVVGDPDTEGQVPQVSFQFIFRAFD
jgi:hypothetical protein